MMGPAAGLEAFYLIRSWGGPMPLTVYGI